MEFDVKCFFVDPPRVKEEVRTYMQQVATRIVQRFAVLCRMLQVDRVHPPHVTLVFAQMAPEPRTQYSRQGLCAVRPAVRPMTRIFRKVVETTMVKVEEGDKYGGVERRLLRSTGVCLRGAHVKATPAAVACVAACVSEVCGLMLNAAHRQMTERTLTLDAVRRHACEQTVAKRVATHTSLREFLECLERPLACERKVVHFDV